MSAILPAEPLPRQTYPPGRYVQEVDVPAGARRARVSVDRTGWTGPEGDKAGKLGAELFDGRDWIDGGNVGFTYGDMAVNGQKRTESGASWDVTGMQKIRVWLWCARAMDTKVSITWR